MKTQKEQIEEMWNVPMRIERVHLIMGDVVPSDILDWIAESPFPGKPKYHEEDDEDAYLSEEEEVERWVQEDCQGRYFLEVSTPVKERMKGSKSSHFSWGHYTMNYFDGPDLSLLIEQAIAWGDKYDGGLKPLPKKKGKKSGKKKRG